MLVHPPREWFLPSFSTSLTTTSGKLLLLIATLGAAILSFHLFFVRWFHGVIDGHTFPVWWEIFSTEDFIQSIPFGWPFAVAGFLLSPSSTNPRVPFRWWLLFGVLGAITYGILIENAFKEMGGTLSTHGLTVYTRAGMPLLFELMGLLTARLVNEV